MPNLTNLANKFQSDKGTQASFAHKYSYLYDLIFWPYQNAKINFLELGLAVGGPDTETGQLERTVDSPSVAMWLEYFPAARVFGFDISDFSHIQHNRFTFTRGDMGQMADLARLASVASHFDIVIDDGSHASFHQQLAFNALWPKVSSGGLYIIEDLHWQSPVYEAKMPTTPLTRDLFAAWYERSTYLDNPVFPQERLRAMAAEVETFAAFPAFNEGNTLSHRLRDGSAKLIVFRKR